MLGRKWGEETIRLAASCRTDDWNAAPGHLLFRPREGMDCRRVSFDFPVLAKLSDCYIHTQKQSIYNQVLLLQICVCVSVYNKLC